MAPKRYTELFFLDEATAFSAGHRPCATCRRERYQRFKELWFAANPGQTTDIKGLDSVLHDQRVNSSGQKQTWTSRLDELPDGAFILVSGKPALYLENNLFAWTPSGYEEVLVAPSTDQVEVLTPVFVCRTFAAGYTPQVHRSVQELLNR